jgi:hypothetical protein
MRVAFQRTPDTAHVRTNSPAIAYPTLPTSIQAARRTSYGPEPPLRKHHGAVAVFRDT